MKVLILEPRDFSEGNLMLLEEIAEVDLGPFSRENLLYAVRNAEVLVVRLSHNIDKEIFEAAEKLKYILSPTTGLNHIDLNEAEVRNVKIISLKGETEFLNQIPSTAEHTWALMLTLIRQIPQAFNHVKQGNWDRDLFKAHNLYYYKLGILGFGRVGQQIAEYAKVFNMPYFFYDIDPDLKNHPQSIDSLEEFLKEIDILSIHIPLNDENVEFLNSSNLQYLKNNTYIVNTSRGEIIDENIIAADLMDKRIGGYATDVLSWEIVSEERKTNPLLKIADFVDNLIITPHIAGATYESMWRTEEFVIRKWIKCLDSLNL